MKIALTKLIDNAAFGRFPGTSTEYALDKFLDARQGEYVSIWLTSSLNQAVTVQVIGNDQDDPGGSVLSSVDLGGAVAVATGGTVTQRHLFTVNTRDYRAQFYGMTVTTGGTAPTAGRLDVVAYIWTPELDELIRQLLEQMAAAAPTPGHGAPPGADSLARRTVKAKADEHGFVTYTGR